MDTIYWVMALGTFVYVVLAGLAGLLLGVVCTVGAGMFLAKSFDVVSKRVWSHRTTG